MKSRPMWSVIGARVNLGFGFWGQRYSIPHPAHYRNWESAAVKMAAGHVMVFDRYGGECVWWGQDMVTCWGVGRYTGSYTSLSILMGSDTFHTTYFESGWLMQVHTVLTWCWFRFQTYMCSDIWSIDLQLLSNWICCFSFGTSVLSLFYHIA